MKVQIHSYLEYCLLDIREQRDYYDKLVANEPLLTTGIKRPLDNRLKIDLEQWYLKRTSQPFKPELITELFKGWEFIAKNTNKYCKGKDSIGIYVRPFVGKPFMQIYLDGYGQPALPIPRTLDDIINDCQRAGIELEWKL